MSPSPLYAPVTSDSGRISCHLYCPSIQLARSTVLHPLEKAIDNRCAIGFAQPGDCMGQSCSPAGIVAHLGHCTYKGARQRRGQFLGTCRIRVVGTGALRQKVLTDKFRPTLRVGSEKPIRYPQLSYDAER